MVVLWSLIAFILTGFLLWLIFFANDEDVLRTMRIPVSSDAAGGGVADGTTAGGRSSTSARMAALNAEEAAGAATLHASAAVAEAGEASLHAMADPTAANQAAAQSAQDAADAAVAEANAAVQASLHATEATTDRADAAAVADFEAHEARVEAATPAAVEETAIDAPQADVVAASDDAAAAADDAVTTTPVDTRSAAVPLTGMATTDNYPDNLTKVNGIGEVYQRRLYENGIFTWGQIAAMNPAELKEMTEAIDAANAEDWPRQARELAAATGRANVRYSGPMPDRLVFLPGIGEGAQDVLRQHGVMTYQQLVDADVEAVSAILKTSGSRADVQEAVAAAKKLLEKSA